MNVKNYFSIDAIQDMVWIALFSALIIVGSYIAIPLPFTPVPIVLQNFFVLLAALVLGTRRSLMAVGLFLLLGVIGFPVFSGGRGGIAHLAGPTGGYLIGYLLAALLCSLCVAAHRHNGKLLLRQILGVTVGTAVIYACGVPWLKQVTGLSWSGALAAGLIPFIIGDLLKAIVAVAVAQGIRSRAIGRRLFFTPRHPSQQAPAHKRST